ncbi:MAG: hypothetical protein AMJ73_04380 [candidate division Zixibacteria bacterium SM1_73]|nr:MAG: hypothetical protein AMJ73_04380 [candidate division Zixibacteria bacterium SM1_73]
MVLTIFSAIGNWVTSNTLQALGGILLLFLGWGVKKHLIPYLNTELKRRMAEYILVIADEVTDQLVAKYPKNDLLRWLDQAVDKIQQITGVSEEVATRAAQAALARKGIKYGAN